MSLKNIFRNSKHNNKTTPKPIIEESSAKQQYDLFTTKYKETYRAARKQYGFPSNAAFESVSIGGRHYYIWKDDTNLKFYEHPHFFTAIWRDFVSHNPQVITSAGTLDFSTIIIDKPDKCSIPLCDIKYFYLAGNNNTKTEIVGGEQTIDFNKMVIGGLLGGTIGALVMGVQATPYRIKTITTDTRKVLLGTKYGTIELPKEDIGALQKIIPEKYSP